MIDSESARPWGRPGSCPSRGQDEANASGKGEPDDAGTADEVVGAAQIMGVIQGRGGLESVI
jgi:hypothetical protein